MIDKSYKRHIAKALTWRIVGTCDTMFLAWIISGNPLMGFKIGLSEVVTKTLLYFAHERVWYKINLNKHGKLLESRTRHLLKTVSWRLVGTFDTMIIAWFISGNPLIGVKVGAAEVITKMVLYYFHERVWYHSNYGLAQRNEEK